MIQRFFAGGMTVKPQSSTPEQPETGADTARTAQTWDFWTKARELADWMEQQDGDGENN